MTDQETDKENFIKQSIIPTLHKLEEEAGDGMNLLAIVIDTEQGTSSVLLNKALEAQPNFEEMLYEVVAHLTYTVEYMVERKAHLSRLDS